jgi:hypothetical protein
MLNAEGHGGSRKCGAERRFEVNGLAINVQRK